MNLQFFSMCITESKLIPVQTDLSFFLLAGAFFEMFYFRSMYYSYYYLIFITSAIRCIVVLLVF